MDKLTHWIQSNSILSGEIQTPELSSYAKSNQGVQRI
jgi:hypothetical protein